MYWHCREHETEKGQAFAWPFLLSPAVRRARRTIMTQHSKSRQQAESAFTKAQSQFLARNRAIEEVDTMAKAREDKTSRLKNARLAKEADDRARATAALSAKRAINA
jgi:hypothetical protein